MLIEAGINLNGVFFNADSGFDVQVVQQKYTDRNMEANIDQLREDPSDMAFLVQSQLTKSVSALLDKDEDLTNEVIHNEKRVNAFELKIEKDCENIFALLTPLAHDMRLVFATLKINPDPERIGDYADGIARFSDYGQKTV